MNSSFFITLIALAVVGAIAYFSAVGFRGAGKIKKVPRNLQKYRQIKWIIFEISSHINSNSS